MANRKSEAQVEFSVINQKFNSGLKEMNTSLKGFRAELQTNSEKLKSVSASADDLKERQSLLKQQYEQSTNKVQLHEQALVECERLLGNNSKEYATLSNKLSIACTEQQKISNEIEKTNQQLRSEQVSEYDSKVSKLNTNLALNSEKLKGNATNISNLKERQTLLKDAVATTSDKVKFLENDLDKCSNTVGKNSTEYNALEKELTEAKTDLTSFQNELKQATKDVDDNSNALQRNKEHFDKIGDGLSGAGKKLLPVTAAYTGGVGLAVKSAIDFETAFTGVKKTVDGTPQQFQQLSDDIRKMATEIPASTTEISAVAEAAGQLGIKTDDIMGFTKVMIDLGNSTNLSSESAASALAKFANVTKMSANDYDRLGSVIVALGNNSATTETDIVEMGTRLAATGELVGLSESNIMGLATVMSSLGIEAEAGGSAMSKLLKTIQVSVETGNGNLKNFASVAGMSIDQFKQAFSTDAVGAMGSFITGLNDTERNGKSAIATLDEMGISEVRMSNTILSMSSSGELLADTLGLADQAWADNSALTNEADQRYETLASKMEITKGKLSDVGISIGQSLMPFLETMVDKLGVAVEWFNGLSDGTKNTILVIGGIAAVAGPVLMVVGSISKGVGALGSVIGGVGKTFGAVTSVGKKVFGVLGGLSPQLLIIIGIIGAVVAVGVLLYKNWDKICEWARNLKEKVVEAWENMMQGIKTKVEEIKTSISTKFEEMKEKVLAPFNFLKDKAGEVLGAAKTTISEKLGNIKNAYNEHGGGIKGVASAAMEGVKGYYTAGYDFINNLTGGKLDGIKNKFKEKMDGIKEVVHGAIEKVKGFFDFDWSLPKIKLPHFSITGGFSISPPSVPKLSINWNAKGGLFTKPTVFQGFGEAGHEYAIPLSERSVAPLASMINKMMLPRGRSSAQTDVENMLSRLERKMDDLMNAKLNATFNLDGRELAKATAAYDDVENGNRYALSERGLAID